MALFPKTTCTVSEALDIIGQHRFGDLWIGTEIDARRLPEPKKAKAAMRQVAQDPTSIDHLSKIVGFIVKQEEFRKWPDPDSDAYKTEWAAYLRHLSASRELLAALRYGHVLSWVVTESGTRIDVAAHWLEEPMQVSVGAFFGKDQRAMLKIGTDEILSIDRSRASLAELVKQLSSVQPVDATVYKPARQKDRPQWSFGRFYVDQAVLVARLSETAEQSSPQTFIDPQGAVSALASHPASTATRKVRRIRDPQEDAMLKNRIEMVLALARRKWPDPKSRPGVKPMARELVRLHRNELGYKFDAVRRILDGTYSVSRRFGISGL